MHFDQFEQSVRQRRPDEVITDGAETIVHRFNDLPFVVKLTGYQFLPPSFTLQGYKNAWDHLGGLVARFTVLSAEPTPIIVQERVRPLQEIIEDRSIRGEDVETMVLQVPDLDREILQRGCYVSDNFFHNYGARDDGSVCLFDLGRVMRDLDNQQGYDPITTSGETATRRDFMEKRGFILYDRIGKLNVFRGSKMADRYRERTGFRYDSEVDLYNVGPDVFTFADQTFAVLQRLGIAPFDDNIDHHEWLHQKIVSGEDDIGSWLYNIVSRIKYSDQFAEIAQQEIDRDFVQDAVGVPAESYLDGVY